MDIASLNEQFFHNVDCQDMPIGVYMVSPDGRLIACNRLVRLMLKLPLQGPIDANIGQFYADPEKRKELLTKAHEHEEQGRFLSRQQIHFRVNGDDLYVEDYCRTLKDGTGQVIGYLGCLVDITDEQQTRIRESQLRHRVEQLTFDIGRILHANTTTLVMVIQTLNGMADALGPNPFGDLAFPPSDEIDDELTRQADHLANQIERFLPVGDEERRLKALPSARWHWLAEQAEYLRDFKQRIQIPEFRPPTLRRIAFEVGETCVSVTPGNIPREAVRELQQAAWIMERITNLIEVLNTRQAVLQMDSSLQSLREFVTADVRETEQRSKLTLKDLMDKVISRLAEYSHSSGVEVKITEIPDVAIMANEREIVRALTNLLHNAIKYTWKRDKVKTSWVSIRINIREGKVHVAFENWGVPIAKEELDKGLIFNLGYRGKWSTDRGRLGTGIGLTDARRIAQAHGGEVLVVSHPARHPALSEDHPDFYKQPFLTTVTITLPVVR